ncbi:nuclear pore complex protein NUP43 [Phalaenopsis equestris]|uniref:nuclear pore complex protein NUP43 n=1 Tax=Phalaenopsis equestris TaxID=78828 RepID=UPI0009E3DF24|nr:nuclear pore complex protein NUP43 [Phalaenopsis equestris]
MAGSGEVQLHRYPQSKSVDAVRWLHPVSAFDGFIAAAVYDTDEASSSVEIHSVRRNNDTENPNRSKPSLHLRSEWPSPSRISSLRTSETPQGRAVAALSTCAGSVHFIFVDPIDGSVDLELSTDEDQPLHNGSVSVVDLQDGGHRCLSVGEDGRVNLVSVGEGRLDNQKVHDNRGLVSYTAVKWGSQAEFATGGFGFGLQWWDLRKPEGLVSQLKGNWAQGNMTGIVHSIDIHPSRKHISVVGGSSGTVFAWDLRWLQEPILLSGATAAGRSPFESEIWEIQYDIQAQSSSISSASSTKILPVMFCSEDGNLVVVEQGKPPIELLAEACPINSFDIDPQNPSDIICGFGWESIGVLMRPKEAALIH